jgi:S1 RNA binding domain protein
LAIEVGSIVEGTVSGITNFGAFVELPEGKVGLIHISEVADEYVSDVKDFLKEKDKVKVKVLNIDDKGKIGLSIKRLQPKKQPEGGKPAGSRPQQPQQRSNGDGDAQPAFHRNTGFRSQAGGNGDFRRSAPRPVSASFEDKLSKFMKDSDELQRDSSRRTDSKRGGRGGRRR